MKEVLIKEIRTLQSQNLDRVQLPEMVTTLYSAVIFNICVGMGSADTKLDYELESGVIEKRNMPDMINLMTRDSFFRQFHWNNLLFPRLATKIYKPADFRYKRNVNRLRQAIQDLIDARRMGQAKTYSDQDDLLSILLQTDFYKDDDPVMIDEIMTFFGAGMKTSQVSSTNLIYYMTKHEDMKSQLLKEILPPVERAKGNLTEGLTYDAVQDFSYLMQCFYESLRIEPSGTTSVLFTVDEDTSFNVKDRKILVKKDTLCNISFESIHHNPDQWPQPEKFEPKRFDMSSCDNPWILTREGKPRNPLSFTPFMGGKRVCIGKTFAELLVRFTMPLLYHHFEFELLEP